MGFSHTPLEVESKHVGELNFKASKRSAPEQHEIDEIKGLWSEWKHHSDPIASIEYIQPFLAYYGETQTSDVLFYIIRYYYLVEIISTWPNFGFSWQFAYSLRQKSKNKNMSVF